MALALVQGWREQWTIPFRTISYWLVQFQLLSLSLPLTPLPCDLVTDLFSSSTSFPAFITAVRTWLEGACLAHFCYTHLPVEKGSQTHLLFDPLHSHLLGGSLEWIAHREGESRAREARFSHRLVHWEVAVFSLSYLTWFLITDYIWLHEATVLAGCGHEGSHDTRNLNSNLFAIKFHLPAILISQKCLKCGFYCLVFL